jgi:hypothetical protein
VPPDVPHSHLDSGRSEPAAGQNQNAEVAQLVQAVSYKPEGRGFGSPWRHWDLAVGSTQSVAEISTRGICWKGGVRAAGA